MKDTLEDTSWSPSVSAPGGTSVLQALTLLEVSSQTRGVYSLVINDLGFCQRGRGVVPRRPPREHLAYTWSVWNLFAKSVSPMTLLPGGSRTLQWRLSWGPRRKEETDRKRLCLLTLLPPLSLILCGQHTAGASLRTGLVHGSRGPSFFLILFLILFYFRESAS